MIDKLVALYGDEGSNIQKSLVDLIETYKVKIGNKGANTPITEKDSILITYGDSIGHQGEPGLRTLKRLLDNHVGDVISGVHILPFYPYSSDDGFSVIDYCAVDPKLGEWADVEALSDHYHLMFDGVINHISQYSSWFEGFKAGDPEYEDFFILCDPNADYSQVVRPRALPLLTPVTVSGEDKFVWTTFSDDQIDLNYANPKVLCKVLEVMLTYVMHGAKYIRLDAIGFAWKEIGTTCIHLPQTHTLIQLLREALLEVKDDLIIITETNVPHEENISYFGDGHNEAHMVYQFPLPPLTLHALLTGDGSALSKWANGLEALSNETTYFNFLASHDGVGLRPVEGKLDLSEVQILLDAVTRNGGRINYKNNSDGSKSPYEMNINYMDALKMEGDTVEGHCDRFLAAQGILYSLVGVPGIYIHSLLGSGNDIEGMEKSGINRRINREKLDYTNLVEGLKTDERRQRVLKGNKKMLMVRQGEPCFNPYGRQEVSLENKGLLGIKRYDTEGLKSVLALINLSNKQMIYSQNVSGRDLLGNQVFKDEKPSLKPYQVMWIK